jgi:hypothetical protein
VPRSGKALWRSWTTASVKPPEPRGREIPE